MKEASLRFGRESARTVKPPQRQSSPRNIPAAASLGQRFLALVRSWFEIPYGYEDENGFHYGHEPAPKFPSAQATTPPQILTDRACDAILPPSKSSPVNTDASGDVRRVTVP
jgi:hypothetical protein